MDPRCRVEMLGPLRLVRDDQTLTRFGTHKAAALLAYLALRLGPRPREQVIDAFWPDMDLTAGRNNLNTALSGLRRLLEPPGVRKGAVLATTHAHVGLDPSAVATDVAEFERLLGLAERATEASERVTLWEQALALYGGDFQPGNYQDWAIGENERLTARRIEALDRLGEGLEAQGRFHEAADVAQQRLTADPYEENVHVALVRRHVRAGHTAAAREACRKFDQFFREEFGAAPSAASQQSVEELLSPSSPVSRPAPHTVDHSPASTRSETAVRRKQTETGKTADPAQAVALPFWLSRFFGREPDLARLAGLMLRTKDTPTGPDLPPRLCRLITLTGPGGTGKTRLAAEFARQAAERFGCWCAFVPLADISKPDQISGQIALALRLPPTSATTPLEQVTSFLKERDCPDAPPALLILDNLEHFLGTNDAQDPADSSAIGVVQALLKEIGGLSILCTSRQRLGLQGEQTIPVKSLPVPESPGNEISPDEIAALMTVPSVRLYVDRAQTVRPDFGLTPTNAPAVAALCRMLDGSPLALELAASWVRILPPRKMWERLAEGEAIPEGRHADLPPRHRSLDAALEWSWRLLSRFQRDALACLSVFRGGWTGDAAEAICGLPDVLAVLAALQEASLVTAQEDAHGDVRYSLLETVRQFAAERLREGGGAQAARGRHLAWCLSLAAKAEPELMGPEQKGWLSRLEAEHDNLRTALDWSEARPEETENGLRLSASLGRFWNVHGHLTEGRRRLAAALTHRQCAPMDLQAKALYEAGALANAQGDNAEATRRLEECLAIRRRNGDAAGCAGPLRLLGIAARQRGDYAAARTLLTESLALAQAAGDDKNVVGVITSLGNLALSEGDLGAAQDLYTRSLPLYRAGGDRRGCAVALGNLGNVASAGGDFAKAKSLLAECLIIYRELGDHRGCAITLHSQAINAIKLGDLDLALAMTLDCLTLYRELGDQQGAIEPMDVLALILAKNGHGLRATRLRAAANTLRQEKGICLPPAQREAQIQENDATRGALGEEAFQAAWTTGGAMSWQDALSLALGPADHS